MSQNSDTTSRIIGTLRVVDDASLDKGIVQMRDRFATSIDDLWSALTEPDRVARWIGEIDGDLKVGGTFNARLTSHWEGPARVDVCDAPRRLVITMRPGQDDETIFTAQLSEADSGTDLVIEESGLPLSEIYAHGAGWQVHVEDLATHIAGRTPGSWVDRWNELSAAYGAMAASLTKPGSGGSER